MMPLGESINSLNKEELAKSSAEAVSQGSAKNNLAVASHPIKLSDASLGAEPSINSAGGSLKEKITSSENNISRLEGIRENLLKQDEDEAYKVGFSKARLEQREEVDSFLEELQRRAHERNTGTISSLLSNITRDVIPDSPEITLDLKMKRGLPSLDIYRTYNGVVENIIGGAGGSVANVISAGLRCITLVRSGLRRFMIMDEPDCWIKPDRIPKFMNVIEKLSRDESINLQVLMISHHDLSMFNGNFNVVRLKKSTSGKIEADCSPDAKEWRNDLDEGIREIRLTNIMSHSDTVIPLSPGVNVLIGDNDIGKSVIGHAVRALSYGDCGDDLIRHEHFYLKGELTKQKAFEMLDYTKDQVSITGLSVYPIQSGEKETLVTIKHNEAKVSLKFEGNREIVFTRNLKGSPKNNWTQFVNGEEIFSTFKELPDWIKKDFGLGLIDDIDVQITSQIDPVFMLKESPSRRANILSLGRESHKIVKMIKQQKDWVAEDRLTVKIGEEKLTTIRLRLQDLVFINDIKPFLMDTVQQTTFPQYNEEKHQIEKITAIVEALTKADMEIKRINSEQLLINALPDVFPQMEETANLLSYGVGLKKINRNLSIAQGEITLFGEVPEFPEFEDVSVLQKTITDLEMMDKRDLFVKSALEITDCIPEFPEFEDVDILKKYVEDLSRFDSALEKNNMAEFKEEENRLKKELDDLIEEMGDCPVCKQEMPSGKHDASCLKEQGSKGEETNA